MIPLHHFLHKNLSDSRPAYQILEDRPGYVGVYIRLGDQPLDEINFALAEAFREHDISARNIKSVRFLQWTTNNLLTFVSWPIAGDRIKPRVTRAQFWPHSNVAIKERSWRFDNSFASRYPSHSWRGQDRGVKTCRSHPKGQCRGLKTTRSFSYWDQGWGLKTHRRVEDQDRIIILTTL